MEFYKYILMNNSTKYINHDVNSLLQLLYKVFPETQQCCPANFITKKSWLSQLI